MKGYIDKQVATKRKLHEAAMEIIKVVAEVAEI